jgi:inositol transport system ATP-binding protein
MSNEYILEMKNISKSFPGVKALDDVGLSVRRGTVHALMGENGAGKSTLMKIAIGIYQADSGTMILDGEEIKNHDIKTSLKKGISMIHQELNPIPQMTVAENIYLGREPLTRSKILDKKKMVKDTQDLLESLGITNINPRTKMVELSVAKKQMVEIAKAISYRSKLIIMDEPTSAITETECQQLFKIVNELKTEGVSFIFITHKMDEVFKITDEVTVFRDGKYVATVSAEGLTRDKLIEMMVGREVSQMFPKEEAVIGDVILSVRNLTKKGLFKDISFNLKRGEILGIAGLMGAGRTEVVETLFGYRKADAGEIYLDGKKIQINSPKDALKHKMALLTEERKLTGLYLPLSVRDNMIVTSVERYIKGLALDKRKIEEACNEQKEKLAIKTPSLNQTVNNLSGGNQQKVLVARWLLTEPDILIVDEPTRGIDVGAKAEIHRLLSALAKEGKAIIMISSELPEIIGMSDRVLVMHEGRLTGELSRIEATQTRIMEYATGTKAQ